MGKKVFYDDEARAKVLAGAEILYNAVKTTLGPKGRNVVISKNYGPATITKDGVTVARSIDLTDTNETMGYKTGVELIKSASSKVNDTVGDGTTSVVVLTYHILNEANKLIAAGHNPMQLRKGLDAACTDALQVLDNMKEDIKGDKKRITEVATISASDKEIGELIADVMDKIGKDGVVTVEEGQGLNLEQEVVKGFTFDRGFVSPYMVTDQARMEIAYEKPAILITDAKISSTTQILPIIEQLAKAGKKEFVIIADDVDGEALSALILNKLKGTFNAVAIKAPSFGDRRKEILNDIAVLTGGTVISEDQGMSLQHTQLQDLGQAQKIIVSKDETTIIEGIGAAEDIEARIAQISDQIKESKSKLDIEHHEQRRAALGGKVAVIRVGGTTETEIEEKKFRVDDAVYAVKAAMEEGIVPGGGTTLVNIAKVLVTPAGDDSSVKAGRKLLYDALEMPFITLLENSGLNPHEWLPQILKADGLGVDVMNSDKLIDLKKAGIVDPARVTKETIRNAVSIAGTGMTMGALVVEEPQEVAQVPGMPPMM